jgi:hypothetical protein
VLSRCLLELLTITPASAIVSLFQPQVNCFLLFLFSSALSPFTVVEQYPFGIYFLQLAPHITKALPQNSKTEGSVHSLPMF